MHDAELHPEAPPLPRAHPATVVAFLWASVAIRIARRGYDRGDHRVRIPPPPPLPEGARRGVVAALRRSRSRCLIEARVRQAWERRHPALTAAA